MATEHRRRDDLQRHLRRTSTAYSFAATAAENGYEYEAVFTNSLGSFTSSAATLTIVVAPTVTTSRPP